MLHVAVLVTFDLTLLGTYHRISDKAELWVKRNCSRVALHGRLLWHRRFQIQAHRHRRHPVVHRVSYTFIFLSASSLGLRIILVQFCL